MRWVLVVGMLAFACNGDEPPPESDFLKCCGTEESPCVCPRGYVYSCAYEYQGTEKVCACRVGEP